MAWKPVAVFLVGVLSQWWGNGDSLIGLTGCFFARVVLFETEVFMLLLSLISGAEEGPEYFWWICSCFLSIHPAHNVSRLSFQTTLGWWDSVEHLCCGWHRGLEHPKPPSYHWPPERNTGADRDLGRATDIQQVLKVTIPRTRVVWSMKRGVWEGSLWLGW